MATNGSTLTAKDHAVAAKAQAARKLARQRKKNKAKNKGLPHGRKPLFDEIREDKRQRRPRVANSRTPRPNR
ncbi:MAG TPA: hypothetical protein PLY16_01520, partial [Candidatus Saccharibacteria bacterium]|nr:hypothetical protein [Candidatus Saccharibacteria bacterium]